MNERAAVKATNIRSSRYVFLRWSGATIVVAMATVVLYFTGIRETAAGLVFLGTVVWFASRSGIRLALYVAALCAFVFDFFFLQPLHTLRLAGKQQWIEMLSFAATSIIVGRLSERSRRHTQQAESRRQDVERLYTLSQEMMLHEDAAHLVRDLPRLIERSFGLATVVLYVLEQDQFYTSVSEVPLSFQAWLRELTMGHNSGLSEAEGFMSLGLTLGMKPIGALAWKPDQLSREAATAIGAQVAIALTRALAIETYTRMEAAREGERLRVALIDSLTHELRTPLTTIRVAASTLVQGEGLDDAARHDLATLVDEESSRLDRLIGEAVEMAELDANVVQVQPVKQNIRALLDHAVAESHRVLGAHRVVVACDDGDESAWFDARLLSRVFRHLLENAARYSPAGSKITLRAELKEDRLEFSVEDNGPGIDAAELPLIFDKFYRGKKGRLIGKGTGMGLAITRAILAAHSGGIEVKNAPNRGSIFRFWIPLTEREPASYE